MPMRIIRITGIMLCATLLLGASLSQCQTSTTNGIGSDGPIFVTSLAVEDASGNAVSTFNSGDPITFVLSVRNRSSSSQTISFNTAQQYNFEVVDSGTATEVWTWSLGQSISPSTSSLTFQAGETQTFTVTWDQVNDNNQLVPTGPYEAIGGVTCNNSSSSSSSSTTSASINCMPTGIATSDQLAPSVFISTLVPFTIQ
jgi:Intracellular proteinase inhibitor